MAAMRQWQAIPKAVLFDNGSHFRGKLLWTFCRNLGIRIIYSSVHHPQTNGKLERAF
jgi:transposase InsO family protein